jgi:Zn-dependent M28 family amino/carboxypeptidase
VVPGDNPKLPTVLRSHVECILNTPSPRTFGDTAALNLVAEYIKQQFSSLGFSPGEQRFNVDGKTYKNITALCGNPKSKRIVIGAHYDVAGKQSGADDNASGVAGLLEIARIIKKNERVLNREVEFVAYTLEENFGSVAMGSFVHAKSLYDRNIAVDFMISLEMIGYFTDKPHSQNFPLGIMKLRYPTTGNFIAAVTTYGSGALVSKIKKAFNSKTKLPCYSLIAPKWVKGVDFSDHRNYWKFKYKALMITDTSFYRNVNYHTIYDMIDTLDFTRMAEVVKGLGYFLLGYYADTQN